MSTWWRNLSLREQRLVAIAAVIGALFLLLTLVAQPLAGWRADAERRARAAEANFKLVSEAASLGAGARFGDSETPARNALTDTARELGLALTFVNAREDGAVDAQAVGVDPELLFRFFAALEERYGVRVIAADIARAAEGGAEVRAQMTVSR